MQACMREHTMSELDEYKKLLIEACKNGLSADVNLILSDVAAETSEVLYSLLDMLNSQGHSEAEIKADALGWFWLGIDAALQNKAEGIISERVVLVDYGKGPDDE